MTLDRSEVRRRAQQWMKDYESAQHYGDLARCAREASQFFASLLTLLDGQEPPKERVSLNGLCSVCEGNGVVKISGGVSTCDHCHGMCWEPVETQLAALTQRLTAVEQEREFQRERADKRVEAYTRLATESESKIERLQEQLETHAAALIALREKYQREFNHDDIAQAKHRVVADLTALIERKEP